MTGSLAGGVNIFRLFFSITTAVGMSSVAKLSRAAIVTHLIKINGDIILGAVCFNLPASRVALSRLSSRVCHAVSPLCYLHCGLALPVLFLSQNCTR